jgi:CheY-like chemotaxis protein
LADFPYNAAVLDVRLADSSTIEFARELMERGIPFVFATGYTDEEPIFAEFPGVAVVQKLYSGTHLVEALAKELPPDDGRDRLVEMLTE